MKPRRMLSTGIAIVMASASVLLLGIEQAGAQSAVVTVDRECLRGSIACLDFSGRTLIITTSFSGTRANPSVGGGLLEIPPGCGDISPTRAVDLPTDGALVVHPRDQAVQLTVNPNRVDGSGTGSFDATPGDRIDIITDTEQCCLNGSGDAVVACTDTAGERTVREIKGNLR